MFLLYFCFSKYLWDWCKIEVENHAGPVILNKFLISLSPDILIHKVKIIIMPPFYCWTTFKWNGPIRSIENSTYILSFE